MASNDFSGHPTDSSQAAALLRQSKALARRLLPPELQPFAAAIPDAPPPRPLQPRVLPVLKYCPALEGFAAPETRALSALLSQEARELTWGQTYAAEDISAAFLERYGWCELLGQRGHFASGELALGVLLLGPETAYPLHSHAAEEIYIVLSGEAAWRKGAAGEKPLPPGSVVHHPPWTPHAMRTEDAPLLALYLWHGGDLTAKSKLSEEAS